MIAKVESASERTIRHLSKTCPYCRAPAGEICKGPDGKRADHTHVLRMQTTYQGSRSEQ